MISKIFISLLNITNASDGYYLDSNRTCTFYGLSTVTLLLMHYLIMKLVFELTSSYIYVYMYIYLSTAALHQVWINLSVYLYTSVALISCRINARFNIRCLLLMGVNVGRVCSWMPARPFDGSWISVCIKWLSPQTRRYMPSAYLFWVNIVVRTETRVDEMGVYPWLGIMLFYLWLILCSNDMEYLIGILLK